jgi:hypothetical protein
MTNSFWRNDAVYDRIRHRIRPYTTVYIPYTLRIRSPYFAIFLRIRLRSDTIVIRSHVLRRNTVVYGAYMAVYGRIRHRIRSFTTVYGVSNRRPGRDLHKEKSNHYLPYVLDDMLQFLSRACDYFSHS